MINKDTKIYGSFSSAPGNNGCIFFNTQFEKGEINAIYKSFYSNDIKSSLDAIKALGISGVGISMPFKVEVIKYLDKIDNIVEDIGACNTIINSNGVLIGYNTDWIGVYGYLKDKKLSTITILGNGGFSRAVQYACNVLNINFKLITRKNWDNINNIDGWIFNATPVDIINEYKLIDGRPSTPQGKIIAELQAKEQYKLYTQNGGT